jgi:hypothetical protein
MEFKSANCSSSVEDNFETDAYARPTGPKIITND